MAAPHLLPPAQASAAKAVARREARAVRAGCDPAHAPTICARLVAAPFAPPGSTIAGTWPIGDEVDLRPALHGLHAKGCTVLLPRTGAPGTALTFHRWRPGASLERGRYGTACPAGPAMTPDVILLPMLAFTPWGERLGYGGGYYDRTLARFPGCLAVGVAYAAQEVSSLPVEVHDHPLDWIVTEQGSVRCGVSA